MSPSLTFLDAETGKLSLDWIALSAMIFGTAVSVLCLVGDDIPLTRAGAVPVACADVAAAPCLLR